MILGVTPPGETKLFLFISGSESEAGKSERINDPY
jgi:hypothetical protein